MKARHTLFLPIIFVAIMFACAEPVFGQCAGVTGTITSNPTTCGSNGTVELNLPDIDPGNFWEVYKAGGNVISNTITAHALNISVQPGRQTVYVYQYTSTGVEVCNITLQYSIGPMLPPNLLVIGAVTSDCSSNDGSISLENAPIGENFSIIDKDNVVVSGPTTITSSTQTIATNLPAGLYRLRQGSCNYLDRAVIINRPSSCYGTCVNTGANLVVNGEFEDGYTGYFSNYAFHSDFSTFCGQFGRHSIGSNANTGSSCPEIWSAIDRNGNNGKFLAVDPSGATGANDSLWRQIIPVCQNTEYVFQAWVKNIYYLDADGAYYENNLVDPIMSLNINGVELYNTGTIARQLQKDSAIWIPVFVTWNSGSNTTANISIANKVTGSGGNDLALDGIFFGKCAPSISILSNPGLGQCISGSVEFTVTSSETNFQWQESVDGGTNWSNLGTNSNVYTDNFPTDNKKYRVFAASSIPGLTEVSCRTVSPTYTITFNGSCFVILPLSFIYLQATNKHYGNELNWKVTGAKAGASFIIERKLANENGFTTIGVVKAIQNLEAYLFIDKETIDNHVQYRVKYSSVDGKTSYSPIVQVGAQKNNKLSLVKISPSPFSNNLFIKFYSRQSQHLEVKLFDLNGICLLTRSFYVKAESNHISQLDLAYLPAGTYVMQFIYGKTRQIQRIVKF